MTWFILYLPISQSSCDGCSKALFEEVRVKEDYINGHHVIFAELEFQKSFWTKENVLGKLFSYCFFSAVQPSHRNRCNSYSKNLFRPGLWWQGLCAHLLNVKSEFLLYCIVLEVSKINVTALALWSCSCFFLHFKSLLFWLQFAFVSTAESEIWYFCCSVK